MSKFIKDGKIRETVSELTITQLLKHGWSKVDDSSDTSGKAYETPRTNRRKKQNKVM